MNIIKDNFYLRKAAFSFGFVLCLINQNSFSEDLHSHSLHDVHRHAQKIQLDKQPIGKPSASITLDYASPEKIVAGEATSIAVNLNSMLETSGSLLVQYKADDGLNILSQSRLSLDFIGKPVSTDILFSAQSNGLYYVNLAVLQLDESNNHIQGRSFVIPIQVGATTDYSGEMSVVQSKAKKELVDFGVKAAESRKIIEMIAE